MSKVYKQQIDENDDDNDVGISSIIDYLQDLFKDERLEVAKFKNQERGETEMIKKDQIINKIDRQNKMNNVAQILKELSWEERFEWVHQQKIKGNRFFKKDLYQQAIDVYVQAIMGVEFQNSDQAKQKRMEQENILPLLTNLATTLIKLKKYDNASTLCDQVLKLDPESIKGNFKKGESLMYCRYYDQAVVYLKKALQLAQKDQDKINIYRIYKKLRNMRKNEQSAYKDMFPKQQSQKNEDDLKKLIEDNKNQSNLNKDEYDFANDIQDYDDEEDDPDEESCDEDEYGYEQRKVKKRIQNGYKQQNIKILEYNDQIESIKQYIGPLSVLMIIPFKVYKYVSNALGCKRRQVTNYFDSDNEDQREEEEQQLDEEEGEEQD